MNMHERQNDKIVRISARPSPCLLFYSTFAQAAREGCDGEAHTFGVEMNEPLASICLKTATTQTTARGTRAFFFLPSLFFLFLNVANKGARGKKTVIIFLRELMLSGFSSLGILDIIP